MKIRDIMSARPILVRQDEPAAELGRLMEVGNVHHLPVVEGDQVLGVWVATEEGPLVLLGPDRVHQAQAGDEAASAMEALLGDAEISMVWDCGLPAGVLTRADALAILRTALSQGAGRRHRRPTIVRLAGPAGAGKTTLLIRTLSRIPRIDAAVVQANAGTPGAVGASGLPDEPGRLLGAPVIDDPHAHWRAGLAKAVAQLADAQLILVEDRDGSLEESPPIGEDAQVAVLPASALAGLRPESMTDVQGLVVTRMDEADEDTARRAIAAVRERHPGLAVFPVAAGHDDRGLDAWTRWLEGQALRR